MRQYIPYARAGSGEEPTKTMDEYLGVDAFLEVARTQPPEVEFGLLIEFLVIFSGNTELAYQRMCEMLVDQAAQSYNAHYAALRKIKARVHELYAAAITEGKQTKRLEADNNNI